MSLLVSCTGNTSEEHHFNSFCEGFANLVRACYTRWAVSFGRTLACLLVVAPAWSRPAQAAYPPPLRVAHGAVAADHPLASQVGAEALRQGGNAVDAACATALALGALSPASSGIGGGGFLVLYVAKEHKVVTLDFRERAPAAATRNMYVKEGKVSPELARHGGLAAAVPGETAGLFEAVQKYGRLGWKKCVQPAARLAHAGAPVSPYLARQIERLHERSGGAFELGALIFPGGRPLRAGQLLERPDFAHTLDALARDPSALYRGPLARELVRAVRAAGGILSEQDLADYRPLWRPPLEGSYRGHRVVSMSPPSSGGVALIESLNVLERHELSKLGWGSSAHLHTLLEALKHAFADRARFLGDPDFVKVPVEKLTSKDYARALDQRLQADHVLRRDQYGTPSPNATQVRGGGTSHLSVVDADGNAAALTTTINGYFGARFVGGSTGIILNNEMDDFSAQPGVPNADGLVTGEGNAIAPGKRPLSSMTPSIVFAADRPWIVVGGAGSARIISGVTQAIVAVVDFDLDAQAAISAPRVHTQWVPERIDLESFIPADVAQALARRGHSIEQSKDYCVLQMITVGKDGTIEAASDPRKQGVPAGY